MESGLAIDNQSVAARKASVKEARAKPVFLAWWRKKTHGLQVGKIGHPLGKLLRKRVHMKLEVLYGGAHKGCRAESLRRVSVLPVWVVWPLSRSI
jgi:hypothetical protein